MTPRTRTLVCWTACLSGVLTGVLMRVHDTEPVALVGSAVIGIYISWIVVWICNKLEFPQ